MPDSLDLSQAETPADTADAPQSDVSQPDLPRPDVIAPDRGQPDTTETPDLAGSDSPASPELPVREDLATDSSDTPPVLGPEVRPDSPPDYPPDLPPPASLLIAPQTQTFDAVAAGSAGAGVTFTVRNGGGSEAGTTTGLGVSLGGSNASDFHVDSTTCSGTLAPGTTCNAVVSFRPQSSGSKSATLVVRATPGGDATATLSSTANTACSLVADSVCPSQCSYSNDADCKKPLGQQCSLTQECRSGNCVDGACCDTGSCGTCMACNLNGAGTCSNKAADAADPACSASAADCRAGGCNGSGACKPALAGTTCGAVQCANTQATGFSPGQYVGAVKQAHTCDGNSATAAACKLGSGTTCNGYVCKADGTDCMQTCTREVDCLGGPTNGYHCAGGVCVARKANGVTCATDLECLSRACNSSGKCVECLTSSDCPHDYPTCSNGTCIGPPNPDCSFDACTFRQACDPSTLTCVGCQGQGSLSCPVGSACWQNSCYIGGGRPYLPGDACEFGTCTDGLCPLVTHTSPIRLCDKHPNSNVCAGDAPSCMSDETGADICQ